MLIRKTKKCYNAHKKYQFFTGYLATIVQLYTFNNYQFTSILHTAVIIPE